MKTIGEIRRERLSALVSEFGSYAELNRKLGLNLRDSTLTQIANSYLDTRTSKPKQMGSAIARNLEEACGKPPGWMDHDPVFDRWARLDEGALRVAEIYQALPAGKLRAMLEATADNILGLADLGDQAAIASQDQRPGNSGSAAPEAPTRQSRVRSTPEKA